MTLLDMASFDVFSPTTSRERSELQYGLMSPLLYWVPQRLRQIRNFAISSIDRTCEHARSHAQSWNASHVVTPYTATYVLSPTTMLRTGSQSTHSNRYRAADGHHRPSSAAPRPVRLVNGDAPGVPTRALVHHVELRPRVMHAHSEALQLVVPCD